MTDTSTQEETAAFRIENVELSLQEATKERAELLATIKSTQVELDSLAKKGMRRPREKMSELDERLKKLERERTIVSIPLKQEKEILWQMSRVEKLKRQVEEFEAHDELVKSRKSEIAVLRDDLRKMSERISALRIELSMAKKAKDLGCSVEELLGMKVDFPPEKLGILIGKKGANVKQLQEKENVSIDVGSKDGEVRILGSLSSLDATAMNIDQILAREEKTVELPKPLVYFLTSKGITSLAEIKDRNPDVDITMDRATGKTKLRGVPDDIQSARNDLESVDIVEQSLTVTAKESAAVVGKQGATINDLVARHQAAIEVTRGKEENDSDADILVVGSLGSVKGAMEELEDIVAQHKEETKTISIDQTLKDMLLSNKGVGVQALSKLVNDGCRDILPGSISVTIDGLGVKLKGKSLVMPKAVEIASDEIRLKEASIVRLEVHPTVIPALIGKGGAGIKKFKEGADSAIIELDRANGHICVCSLDKPSDTVKVAQALEAFIQDNQVKAIDLEPRFFQNQFRILLRAKTWKELNELVTVSRDDELFQVLLRGTAENIDKAAGILASFLEEHSQDEISVTQDDCSALLRGGKKCKIEEISKSHDVRLNCDTDNGVVTVTGNKDKIEEAKKAVNLFLNGGEGIIVVRIAVDDYSVGALVGRAGNTKAATEKLFPSVSISIPNETVVLRGPEEDVNACQKHLARLLTMAVTTEKLVSDDKMKEISKSTKVRDRLKSLPVQATFEDNHITLKGLRADVFYAAALLKDESGGFYENRVLLEVSCFQKLQNASRESHLSDIQNATRTKIDMLPASSSITIRGKRSNVLAAKTRLLQFLGFLLAETFAFESTPDHAMKLFTQSARLGAIAEESGAFLYMDRDISGLVISASSAESVKKAKEVFNSKLSSLDESTYKLDLGIDGDWLAPALIGKGGSRVRTLRKSWECSVVISDNTVTLVCDDPEKLLQARNSLDKIVADERAQCFATELSGENMSAFLGEKGVHVKEFEERHNVQVKTSRGGQGRSSLRISGSIDDVAYAKLAYEEWLQQQYQQEKDAVGGGEDEDGDDGDANADDEDDVADESVELYNFEPFESLLLRRLIGRNGNRINALRRRCKPCRIEIDVDNLTLKITSHDKKRLEVAKGVVDRILEEERSQNIFIQLSNQAISAFIGAKGSRVKAFEATHGVKVQIVKSEPLGINISGEQDALLEAKAAVEEWLTKRADSSSNEMVFDDEGGDSVNGSTPPRHPYAPTDKSRFVATPETPDFPALVATETNDTVPSSQSWTSVLHSPAKETMDLAEGTN